jgi:hypothetical protein
VKDFAEHFEGMARVVVEGSAVAVAAIASITGAVITLGEKGSTIIGVTDAFDRLAIKAGTTGEALRSGLSEGVKGTVDDLKLMETTSRLLTTGMKLTEDQTLLMGQAAREMGKATGTDAAQGLQTLSTALTTGRTRSLAMQGIVVDLKKAQEDFARSLGTTTDQLSAEGVLEAKRIAILQATQTYVDRLGVSQLTFKERIQQAQVAVEEWGDKLAVSVASSPHVMAALDAIGAAITKAFGGDGQDALETITGWINKFADAVATYGPRIIETMGEVKDSIVSLYDYIKEHKEEIENLAVGVGGVALAWGAFSLGSALVTSIIAGFAAIQAAAIAAAGAAATIPGAGAAGAAGGAGAAAGGAGIGFLLTRLRGTGLTGGLQGLGIGTIGLMGGGLALANASSETRTLDAETKQIVDDIANGRRELVTMDQSIQKALATVKAPAIFGAGPAIPTLAPTPGVGLVSPPSTEGLVKPPDTAKIEAAIQASLTKITGYYDDFSSRIAALLQGTLEAQLSGLAKWDDAQQESIAKQLAAAKKAHEATPAYLKASLDEQQALNADYAAKRIEIFAKSDAEAQASVAKGFAGQTDALKNLSQATATFAAEVDASWNGIGDATDHMVEALKSGTLLVGEALKGLPAIITPIGTEFTRVQQIIATTMAKNAQSFLPLTDAEKAQVVQLHNLGFTVDEIAPIFGRNFRVIQGTVKDTTDILKTLGTVLGSLSADFVQIAQISGGTFSNVAKNIGLAVKAGEELSKALDFMSSVQSGATKGGWNAANLSTLAAGWIGVATAFYSVVQSMEAAAAAAHQIALAKELATSVANAFESASVFSDSLNASIAQTNKQLEDSDMSILLASKDFQDWIQKAGQGSAVKLSETVSAALNLGQIIKELGGASTLTAEQLKDVQDRFDLLFIVIKSGGAVGVKAINAMDDAMQEFADAANKSGGFVSDTFLQVAKDAQKAGVELEKVKAFQQAQTARAATGLNAVFGGFDASKQAGGTGLQIASSAQAQGLGGSIAGTFASALAGGATTRQAIESVKTSIDAMNKALKDTAFNGGWAFIGLTRLSDIAANAVQGPLLDAIDGAKQAIIGMGNAGYLDQQSFAALALTATQAYQQIIADGGDANAAAMAMRPTLQTLWEGEQKFGYTTDAATQALIDQGVANGTIGEAMKSTNDKILDVLVAIGEAFGVVIPAGIHNTSAASAEAAARMGKDWETAAGKAQNSIGGIQTSLDDLKPRPLNIPINVDIPPGIQDVPLNNSYSMGTVYAATGARILPFTPRGTDVVPAMLTPGETVRTQQMEQDVQRRLNGTDGTVIDLRGSMVLDGPSLQRFIDTHVWKKMGDAVNIRDVGGATNVIKKAAS